MPVEHSAGAVLFRREAGDLCYLLLHYEEGHWGSPKGHLENQETERGDSPPRNPGGNRLDGYRFIEGFKELNEYFFTSRAKKSI